jgi:oxygen-independent coproporphyrinogen-3 oxidase
MLAETVPYPIPSGQPNSVYMHIPFCVQKCGYCDFLSFPLHSPWALESYLGALVEEVKLNHGASPVTIYVGGGTPSLLSPRQIDMLGGALETNFELVGVREFTVEVNPETLGPQNVGAWRKLGVNRISLGVQSFDVSVLSGNGRPQGPEDIYRSYRFLRDAGFSNIGIDLILGLQPSYREVRNSSMTEVILEDLKRAVELEPEHISVYLLNLSGNSVIGRRFLDGEINLLGDRTLEKLYLHAVEFLGRHGYSQYEISNFSRPGYESLHNLGYWRGEEYLGMGLGAVSTIRGVRTRNHLELETYMKSMARGEKPVGEIEVLDDRVRRVEHIMLSLRQPWGMPLSEFEDTGDRLHRYFGFLEHRNLAVLERGFFALTPGGLLRSNTIIADILRLMEDIQSRHS